MTDDEARGEARRGRRARRAAAGMTLNGPWQWQWRHQRRRRRAVGCLLWVVTLAVVVVVLALLFGGFQRGTKTGGIGPPAPVTAPLALGRISPGAPAA
jgi:hypothetical protein